MSTRSTLLAAALSATRLVADYRPGLLLRLCQSWVRCLEGQLVEAVVAGRYTTKTPAAGLAWLWSRCGRSRRLLICRVGAVHPWWRRSRQALLAKAFSSHCCRLHTHKTIYILNNSEHALTINQPDNQLLKCCNIWGQICCAYLCRIPLCTLAEPVHHYRRTS
jgi:hypothetical protein